MKCELVLAPLRLGLPDGGVMAADLGRRRIRFFKPKNAKVKLVLTLLKQSHGVVPRTRHKGALAREHARLSGLCEMYSALA